MALLGRDALAGAYEPIIVLRFAGTCASLLSLARARRTRHAQLVFPVGVRTRDLVQGAGPAASGNETAGRESKVDERERRGGGFRSVRSIARWFGRETLVTMLALMHADERDKKEREGRDEASTSVPLSRAWAAAVSREARPRLFGRNPGFSSRVCRNGGGQDVTERE